MFKHLGIGGKLWLAVAALVVAMVSIVGLAAWRAASQQQLADSALKISDRKLAVAHEWASLSEVAMVRSVATNISADEAVAANFKQPIADAIAKITELQKEVQALPLDAQDQAQLDKIAAKRKVVLALSADIKKLKTAGQLDEARAAVDQQFVPASSEYLNTLKAFAALQAQAGVNVRAELAAGR